MSNWNGKVSHLRSKSLFHHGSRSDLRNVVVVRIPPFDVFLEMDGQSLGFQRDGYLDVMCYTVVGDSLAETSGWRANWEGDVEAIRVDTRVRGGALTAHLRRG